MMSKVYIRRDDGHNDPIIYTYESENAVIAKLANYSYPAEEMRRALFEEDENGFCEGMIEADGDLWTVVTADELRREANHLFLQAEQMERDEEVTG